MTIRNERLFFLIKSHEFISENCLNYGIQNESTFYTEKDTKKREQLTRLLLTADTRLLPH